MPTRSEDSQPGFMPIPSIPSPAREAGPRSPSWYLDPLVADQKRCAHVELLTICAGGSSPRVFLKTDLFEEAYGDDALFPSVAPYAGLRLGIDISVPTVQAAAARHTDHAVSLLSADVRCLPFRSGSVGLILSNSTLDHFQTTAELRAALAELARVLEPGGRIIVTLDNPWNPLYWLLRVMSRVRATPFSLGCTLSAPKLVETLKDCGLEIERTGTLLHNPRVVSTILFLALRRCLGERADAPVRGLLRIFALGERLPTRWLTACFVTACARKPVAET
jgi:SAM-dependent methyltransferase